jgi:hypothetical protein
MANKEAVFSLRVDTGNSVQDVQSFDKAVNNLNKDLQSAQKTASSGTGLDDFATRLEELNTRVEAGGLSLREMTQVMKQYQTIAAQAGVESPVGAQAIQNAANLKDEIGDLKAATTALSSDFVGLDTTLAGIETGAAIFGGFQSAIALTGVESEQLVQTMVKLQAVQGVVNAVSTVANNLNKDAILGIQLRNGLEKLGNFIKTGSITATVAQTTASGGLATAQGAVAVATAGASTAMKAFRTALIATGIGAIIVLLGVAAEAMGFFGDETEDAEKAQKKLDDTLKVTTKSLNEQSQATSELVQSVGQDTERLVALAKARGASEKEITDIKISQSGLQRRLLSNDVEFQKKEYYKALNTRKITLEQITEFETLYFGAKQKLQDFDAANNLKVAENAAKVAENAEKVRKDQAEKAKAASDKAREQRKTDLAKVKEAEDAFNLSMLSNKEQEVAAENKKYSELINLAVKHGQDASTLRLALKNSLNDIEAKYTQIEIDLAEKTAKEKRDIDIAEFNRKEALRREEIATEEAFFDEYNAALLTQQQTEEQAVTDKYFKLIEGAKQYGLDITKLEEQQQQEINKIQNKYAVERIQKQLDNAQFIFDQFSALNDAFSALEDARMQNMQSRANDELSALDAKHKAELENTNLTAEQRKAIDQNYAEAKYQIELKNFNALEAIKKRQFERDKILRIGQAAIDTAAAIVKGIAQFGPPPSPAGIAAIASAALIGATQIAAIASTKYQSGTAPTFDTGGGVSAGAGSAALGGQNANTNTQQTDLTALAAQQSAGVNQVYVLESDITSTQNNVAIQNKLSVW